MAYIQLLREVIPNPDATGSPFVATITFWDTDRRTYYRTQADSQVNDPAELAVGTEVQRVTLLSGKDRVFYYAGYGRVQTRHVTGTTNGGVVCTLASPSIIPNPAYSSGADDAAIDVQPVLGAGPYQITLTSTAGYSLTHTAPNSIYPVRFYHLPAGNYTASVVDILGCKNSALIQITINPQGIPYGIVLQESYSGDSTDGSGSRIVWNTDRLQIENYGYQGGGTDGYFYQNQQGNVVDGFYLPDGITFRTVYADGNGGVYFRDSDSTATNGKLQLDNLILLDPSTDTEHNGGVIVEVNATDLPVTFTRGGVSNQTGRFDGLSAGADTVVCTDSAGNSLTVPFLLEQPYRLRWYLDFSQTDKVPLRLELWQKNYTGEPELIEGQATPVTLTSDGLNSSLGGQGDLPPVVGSSCEMQLLVTPDTFEEILLATDRECRCDYYRDGQLRFRGFVQPDVSDQEMQDGLVPVTLTAADGLAALKNTNMLGHIGQRLGTHRQLLHTLLHCLSRCGVSLPLALYTNRRSTEMSDDENMENAAVTDRTGYWDTSKDEPIDMRTVLDAVCQALGGTLIQREGTWQLRSPLEALADTRGRTYRPAGNAIGDVVATAPTDFVQPLSKGNVVGWLTANQRKKVRPGWLSLVGTTDAGWQKNAFPPGDVFSDKYAWLDDTSALRPINGWTSAPGKIFPLVLLRAGEKGTDHRTQWLRSSTPATNDGNYLESPVLPLVAAPENCQAIFTITAKLIPTEILYASDQLGTRLSAATPTQATLWFEIVVDGQRPPKPSVAIFKLASGGATDKDSTYTEELLALPAGTKSAVLRLYAWTADNADLLLQSRAFDRAADNGIGDLVKYDFGTGVYRVFETRFISAANNPNKSIPTGLPDDPYYLELPTVASTGKLLITSVGIELRPQQATWDAEDNFRAVGPAGTVQPTEPLKVYHPDVPVESGIFEGNRYAFKKAVTLYDGSLSTAWARDLDKQPSPLFEATIYDSLVLRDGPARLLTGILSYRGTNPVNLLDTLDTPYDVPGRRFLVAAVESNEKLARTEVSLIEIGPGSDATDPNANLPEGVRIIDQVYQYAIGKYTNYVRGCSDGSIRVRGL